MLFSQFFTLAVALVTFSHAQRYVTPPWLLTSQIRSHPSGETSNISSPSNNGQYTPWSPTTTTQEIWAPTTTTSNYWTTQTTTSNYWTSSPTTSYYPTTPYAWTSYTTVTSCYTENGVTITITTWVPCPCESYGPTTSDNFNIGTTTETLVTTTTLPYSTYTSNNIVYVVPVSTPVTTTASAGLEIVSASSGAGAVGWKGMGWGGMGELMRLVVVVGGLVLGAVVL
jgi:hypothetical protein